MLGRVPETQDLGRIHKVQQGSMRSTKQVCSSPDLLLAFIAPSTSGLQDSLKSSKALHLDDISEGQPDCRLLVIHSDLRCA